MKAMVSTAIFGQMAEMEMKKTEYIVLTETSMTRNIWNRVYLGEDGNRYVKKSGRWINIEDKPCITSIIKSRTTR